MNNQGIYKRIKIEWLIISFVVGILAFFLFIYIRDGSGQSIDVDIIMFCVLLFIAALIIFNARYKVIIDDYFVTFHMLLSRLMPLKIPIAKIKSISAKPVTGRFTFTPEENLENYQFDFWAPQVVRIQLKNGYKYEITIKNAQKIKEEIEKRIKYA